MQSGPGYNCTISVDVKGKTNDATLRKKKGISLFANAEQAGKTSSMQYPHAHLFYQHHGLIDDALLHQVKVMQ